MFLDLRNIWHKDFTETMFDMASVRRLRALSLSFAEQVPLPNFSEALTRFSALTMLRLEKLDLRKINQPVFFEFLQHLTFLSLEKVELNGPGQLKEVILQSTKLRILHLGNLNVGSLENLTDLLSERRNPVYEVILDNIPGHMTFADLRVSKLTLKKIKIIAV